MIVFTTNNLINESAVDMIAYTENKKSNDKLRFKQNKSDYI